MRKNDKKKPLVSNIYQHLQKDEKNKELEYEIFNQVFGNLFLSGTIFRKAGPRDFYLSNYDIFIKSFSNITFMRQDIDQKENKIRYFKHPIEILLEVSELKLNEINNQTSSIHTSVNNITPSNDCSLIISNQDINKIIFLREELKSKNRIINKYFIRKYLC